MRRRDFVKAIVAASASAKAMLGQQPAPPGWHPLCRLLCRPPHRRRLDPCLGCGDFMEAKPLPIASIVPDAVAQTNANFFSEQQFATLRRLSEILLPALKGYPGAKEAGTPEFIDFLIGVSPRERQEMYQFGLDRLDAESKNRFGQTFAALDRHSDTIASSMVEDMDDRIIHLLNPTRTSSISCIVISGQQQSIHRLGAKRDDKRRMWSCIGFRSILTSIEKVQPQPAEPLTKTAFVTANTTMDHDR